MADAPLNQLSYIGIDKPTLGYRTNTSPVDESPHWVFGSQNTMATIVGEMEKRPGFSLAVEIGPERSSPVQLSDCIPGGGFPARSSSWHRSRLRLPARCLKFGSMKSA